MSTAKENGINNVDILFKLDSGAKVNILPEKDFNETGLKLDKSMLTLKSYSGHVTTPLGQTTAQVSVGKHGYSVSFQMVSGSGKTLLDLKACERMCLLSR